MDFFDSLVLPHSGDNLILLKYLLILVNVVFLIFSGVLFSSSILSYIFRNRSRKLLKNGQGALTDSHFFFRLSSDYVDLITSSKMMGFGLGIIPFFSIIMIYNQLLYLTTVNISGYLVFAFILYLIGIILAYSYKHSLHLSWIFKRINPNENIDEEEIQNYKIATEKLNSRTSIWSIIFLFFSLWIFVGSSALVVDKAHWIGEISLLNVFFSFDSITKFLHFIITAFGITGVAFIVKFYFWDKPSFERSEKYSDYSQKLNAWIALAFTFFQPIFFVFNLFTTPKTAMTNQIYIIIAVIFFLSFIVLHLFYQSIKENKYNSAVPAFYILLLIFALIIYKEQSAFGISVSEQILILADRYEQEEKATLLAAGGGEPKVNGEELYKAKCVACHRFDEKLVGPPHKEVLVKYLNKKDDMVKFILNPVKVDPNYPPMPAQGLKPNEAKAIVEYMYEHYGDQIK